LLIVDFQQLTRRVLQIEKQSSHQLSDYLGMLLSALAQSAIQNQKSEILSDREIEILRLVALGLSNNEISQQLYLVLSSVKGAYHADIRQTPGSKAHRSCRPCPRV